MRFRFPALAIAIATAGCPAVARANETEPSSVGDLLPKWLRVNATVRGRWENTAAISPDWGDSYYLNRLRIGIKVQPRPWLKLFAETQDTRVWGYPSPNPAASMRNPFDLRQAYIEVGGSEGRGATLRYGRQELVYGSGRIFSAGEWSNTGRTFDVLRESFYRPGAKVDVFLGSVVLPDGTRFDRHKPGEHIFGTYSSFDRLLRGAVIEPYFFAKTQKNVTGETGWRGDAETLYAGVRIIGRLPARVDYSFEMVKQWGSYARDSVSAFGGTYTAGWTVTNSGWKPRLSADFSHASGDNASKDGVRRTFDLMYGSSQPYFSLTGMIGWKNLREVRAGIDLSPGKKLKFLFDYRDIHLATTQDGLYNSSGTRVYLNRNATSNHVGEGFDAQVAYTLPKGITVAGGIGTLFAGPYLEQTGQHGTFVYPYFVWGKKF